MTKIDRLSYIRNRVQAKPALSVDAANLLEELQKEDESLGGPASFGEVLAPDNVREEPTEAVTEDESEYNTSLVSPLMLAATD